MNKNIIVHISSKGLRNKTDFLSSLTRLHISVFNRIEFLLRRSSLGARACATNGVRIRRGYLEWSQCSPGPGGDVGGEELVQVGDQHPRVECVIDATAVDSKLEYTADEVPLQGSVIA